VVSVELLELVGFEGVFDSFSQATKKLIKTVKINRFFIIDECYYTKLNKILRKLYID
jgi:hypothetical protein